MRIAAARRRQSATTRVTRQAVCALLLFSISPTAGSLGADPVGRLDAAPGQQQATDPFAEARADLVRELRGQGIESEAVLAAVGRVPRHRFVPAGIVDLAYVNQALPIGHEQTISQPYIVALMTELIDPQPTDRVLEIGTGSGYQAAVLGELGVELFTIEIVPELAANAETKLERMGYDRVHVRLGDGYLGWPEEAPFDKVIVTAAPEEIPAALVEQLRVGGRMVVPVGPRYAVQQLTLLEKDEDGRVRTSRIIPVRFVPMVK